ncbi:MAG: DUF309 domain-containing protein [Sulfurovum sp.]|nr:DUF309 domain-containing protein [Sulfurovum sp.]
MLTMNEDLEGAIKEYLKLLDEEAYFEAHEAMEEAWHPLRLKKHPLANLTKGFINAAIGFEHIKRDSKNAHKKAKRVMESYDRYIDLCKEGINHYTLFKEAKEKIETLKEKHSEVFD